MMRFLRYNSCHHLWFPRGYKGRVWPQLDPIESSSHGANDKRTFGFHEPVWVMRLRQRVFSFGGRQRCASRNDTSVFRTGHSSEQYPDTWDYGPDGNRTCSYCGSIHPDDLMTIARRVPTDMRYGIEGTTKNYKAYVKQPGVRNASEGAIKFYMWHAPAQPSDADQATYAEAMRITRGRFNEQLAAMRRAS